MDTWENRYDFEFGPFLLDVERYVLLREGEQIALTHKEFELLRVLIENRGRALGKEALLETVWAESIVAEANLTQTIYKLRKALGDDLRRPAYIETVPKFGYRFIGRVREVRAESTPRRGGAADADAGLSLSSLAVLPFRLLGGGTVTEFLGLGMADAIITKISAISRLIIRPTSAIIKYVAGPYHSAELARRLEVDALLEGTVQLDGDRMRVTVQLVSAAGYHLIWVEKFDEPFTNVFAVQDAISEHIVSHLSLKISSRERELLSKRHTANPEAFLAHIKGRFFWNKRTEEGLKKSIEYAQRAIECDPAYALAYAGLADSYNLLASHAGLAPNETFPKARAAATRALEIDDALAEAYNSFAFVCYRYDWAWAQSAGHFSRALALKPGYSTALHWYGEMLLTTGHFEEAVAHSRKSLEVDPLSVPANAGLARAFFFARRYEECEQQLRKTIEMDPAFFRTCVLLATLLEQVGELREALVWARRAAALSVGNPLPLSVLGHLYGRAGMRAEAFGVLRSLEGLARKRYVSSYNMAVVYHGLGDDQAVRHWLEAAVEKRDVWLVWLNTHPRFDRLRGTAWFTHLLRRVGFEA